MSRFIQLHVLTNYPPSNLNRDDTGRPKSALVGNTSRLRVSSQSQKRAWRTSDVFQAALAGKLGTRTKQLGHQVFAKFVAAGISEKNAREWARLIAGVFGKLKAEKKEKGEDKAEASNNSDLEIEQLAHLSPEELAAVDTLVTACSERKTKPEDHELKLLRQPETAVDIAMFGRMLASAPDFNMEAAIQVAHAITVHQAAVEDDYFSAIDDLETNHRGAAHIGERAYGAGLFYLYICINKALLIENLGGNTELANQALAAFLEVVAKVSPTGMQNSHASRAYASYLLAEKGDQQPRSLAEAFLKPVQPDLDESMLEKAVAALEKRYENLDAVYGVCADARQAFNTETGEGSFAALLEFIQG